MYDYFKGQAPLIADKILDTSIVKMSQKKLLKKLKKIVKVEEKFQKISLLTNLRT